ncbi:MAG TPA: hypothetical protein VKT25_05215 [Ktedonobacteraceae bacterium]|nr:hypothetical protein [Ktedonobacteraceae bacterium]
MRDIGRLLLVLGVVLLMWVAWLTMGVVTSSQSPRVTAVLYTGHGSGQAYSVVGPPTISASFIDQVLTAYHSPAAGLGTVIEQQGIHYGIDPVFALAFFQHESSFGTTGEARVTLSPGNERCIAGRPCIDQDRGGYAQMRSWADGFDHWYRLILYGYVQGQVTKPLVGHICTTVAEIIPVYAPSSDGNDEAGYIAAVEHAVDTWRHGQVWT